MDDASPVRHISEVGLRAALNEWAAEEARIPIVPCDSPIEDTFLWEFKKVAADHVQLRRQHYCRTAAGAFKIDFVLSCIRSGKKIGIECGGRDFHSEAKDSQRDAAIIATGVVDKIYRLRGRDIHFHIHDALHLLSRREPWLFSERGQAHFDHLSEREALREDVWRLCSAQDSRTVSCGRISSGRGMPVNMITKTMSRTRNTSRGFPLLYVGPSETPN